MNQALSSERERRLRKVAILIGSLDDRLAERMLAEMPAADAKAVRTAIDHLGHVEAEETRAIVDQFRRSSSRESRPATPRRTEGVELDASLLARMEQHDDGDWEKPAETKPSPLTGLSDAEEATIADALSREHPQTVALVISRLEHAAAAKVLTLLSHELQDEVLNRVSELDPADHQSVQVVESQLEQWINQQRQRNQRMAAGAELVQRILQSTAEKDRTAILTRLGGRNPRLAGQFTQNEPNATAPKDVVARPKITKQQITKSLDRRFAAKRAEQVESSPAPRPQVAASADPLGDLERADDASLMKALTQTDRHIVTLALAGASEQLMKRVLRRLPRRQAKEFRQRLRDIGPTRLSDMFAAQQQLAHNASKPV